jgi:hypothetical protein
VIQPVYDNIKKYSPKVAHGLRNADAIQHRRQHIWTTAVKPWQEFVTKKLSKEAKVQLKKLLSNGGFNKATMQFIKEQGGVEAVANAKKVSQTMDEILQMYKQAGYRVEGREGYFPLAVKDLDGLRKREQGLLDNIYAKEQARQGGRALTPNQKAHIAEHYFSFDLRYSKTSGSLKKRMKKEVADDELEFYHNPEDALHYYIHTAAEDIAKREFFKSFGHKVGKKGLNPNGTDIDDSISSLIDQIKKDVPGFDGQSEVARLLRARFSADVHKTYNFVQAIKNLSYAGTLGNYWSAMTQIGDLVFAFHKYGIKAAVGAIFGPKVTSRAELGVEKAMAELQSETMGITSKIADKAFKWSGFDAIDRFGKNVNINASLRQNKQLAIKNPEKFRAKWGEKFGAETDSVMNELANLKLQKNAELSDNVYLMLWNDLAETQPIGLSEMPEKYLKMPNGRIFYAYKTFAMKQLNYMRNMINSDQNAFRKAHNLTYFATMFVLANSTIDGFKDFVAGKELNMEDKVFDNIVSLLGTSKYAVDKSQGLGGVIMQGLTPVPLEQGAKALDKISTLDVTPGDIVSQVPIVGAINKKYGLME